MARCNPTEGAAPQKGVCRRECPVGGAVITDLCGQERAALLEDVALTSLQGMFTAVPDPRSCQGRRYPLSFLLTCLVAAFVGNCTGLDAVGQWCREHREVLEAVFGPRRHLGVFA